MMIVKLRTDYTDKQLSEAFSPAVFFVGGPRGDFGDHLFEVEGEVFSRGEWMLEVKPINKKPVTLYRWPAQVFEEVIEENGEIE